MADIKKQTEAIIYKIELLPTKAEKLKETKKIIMGLMQKINDLESIKIEIGSMTITDILNLKRQNQNLKNIIIGQQKEIEKLKGEHNAVKR